MHKLQRRSECALNYWIALTVVNRPTAYVYTLFRSAKGNRDWNFAHNFCEKISRFHSIYISHSKKWKSYKCMVWKFAIAAPLEMYSFTFIDASFHKTSVHMWFLFSLFHRKADGSKIFTVPKCTTQCHWFVGLHFSVECIFMTYW